MDADHVGGNEKLSKAGLSILPGAVAAGAGLGDDVAREFRRRERVRARERAHADGSGGAADPVGALADEDVCLPHVFDVPERRRHSDHPPARRAHRRRRHRVLPPRRRDCDRRHHRHDTISVHRRRARRHAAGRARRAEPPDGSEHPQRAAAVVPRSHVPRARATATSTTSSICWSTGTRSPSCATGCRI